MYTLMTPLSMNLALLPLGILTLAVKVTAGDTFVSDKLAKMPPDRLITFLSLDLKFMALSLVFAMTSIKLLVKLKICFEDRGNKFDVKSNR